MAPVNPGHRKLAEENLRLAHWAARRYLRTLRARGHRAGGLYDDLVAEASLALVQAARGYDPAKGRFSTYAVTAIRNALGRHFAGVCRRGFGRVPGGVRAPGVVPLRGRGPRYRDGYQIYYDGGNEPEARPDGPEPDWEEYCRSLPGRQREVALAYFRDNQTLHEIAARLGVSYQRVQVVLATARGRLEKMLREAC